MEETQNQEAKNKGEEAKVVIDVCCCMQCRDCVIDAAREWKFGLFAASVCCGAIAFIFFGAFTNLVTILTVCDGREDNEKFPPLILGSCFMQMIVAFLGAALYVQRLERPTRQMSRKEYLDKLSENKMWIYFIWHKYDVFFGVVAPILIQNVCNAIAIIVHFSRENQFTCEQDSLLVVAGFFVSFACVLLLGILQCFTKVEFPRI